MTKSKRTISRQDVFWATQGLVEETIKSVFWAEEMLYKGGMERNDAEHFFMKLCLERVVTNLHQLIKAYKQNTGLSLSAVEESAYKRVATVREHLVHAYTNADQICKQQGIRGNYLVCSGKGTVMKTASTSLSNEFEDDTKIFYGANCVLLRRDLLRLTCRVSQHINLHPSTVHKLFIPPDIAEILALREPEPA